MVGKKIKKTTGRQEEELVERLGWEFQTIQHLYWILKQVNRQTPRKKGHGFFWTVTQNSYEYALSSKLWKLFDDNNDVFSLLNFVERYLPIWDDIGMYKYVGIDDGIEWYDVDLNWLKGIDNPAKEKLIKARHRFIAHNNLHGWIGSNPADDALTFEEGRELLNKCYAIFRRYGGVILNDFDGYGFQDSENDLENKYRGLFEDLMGYEKSQG